MRISVLGSLYVEGDDDRSFRGSVRGPQLGRLLAALVIDAGTVVSVDRLADIVFDGRPTDAAPTTLRSYVGRLRRLLGDDGSGVAIVTSRPGYRLDLGASTVDAHEFEALLRDAQRRLAEGEQGRALEQLDAALALWRGAAYAEFADEEWARLEAIRLDELRNDATELRLRTLVTAGRHEAAVADLGRFVEQHPLREEAQSALVLALYRAGRQTEALRAATSFRRAVGEAGLEPSADFVTLEGQVARHDPSIGAGEEPRRLRRGYRIVTDLGRGGHGDLSLAVQPGVEREVVLRTFGPELADHPDFIRGFPGLVQRVARVEHLNVVAVLDYWREPGAAHLVTRFVRGGSAASLIAKGPAPTGRVVAMVEHVVGALDAAHRSGLAHGALGAGDVLLDDDGNAYVDGVGVASFLDRFGEATAPAGSAVAEDQRAVAVLAHRALTGDAPAQQGYPVSADRPELLALDGVFARATAVDPADRYPDIAAFGRSFLRAVGRPVPATGRHAANPYKGLRAFEEADTEDFRGRAEATERLVARLADDSPAARFVTAIGASGSGKSSVVRAGLLPRLRAGAVHGSDDWYIAAMAPGHDPFAAWDEALGQIAVSGGASIDSRRHGIASSVRRAVPPGAEVLVVVDQLEELYTVVADESVRDDFIDGLTAAVAEPGSSLRVVATLRADLYDRPLGHHLLGGLIAGGAVPLVGMSPAELEEAIVHPAAGAGVTVDGPLVAELVAAVADRAGSLPLLEFALTELFDHRSAVALTLADHRRLGGLTGAIAARAEEIYRALDDEERESTRLLFLRLVTFGGDRTDLRRRTTRRELETVPALAQHVGTVLDRFGSARLLTFDRDSETRATTVEVAHETLLRSWPRLAGWITDEGRGLALRQDLGSAAERWDSSGRQPADLFRATRLAALESWATDHQGDLTALEQQFLDASIDARHADERAQREQLDRQRRANRRLRVAAGAIAAVLVVAVTMGMLAWRQRDRAVDERAAAEQARGRTLAATAAASVADDRSLALLLAVEASHLDDSPVTRHALLAALGGDGPFTRTLVPTPATDYSAMAVSADGGVVAARREDGSVDVIDLELRTVVATGLTGPQSPGAGVDIDPDGALVAIAGLVADEGAGVVVHDIAAGEVVANLVGVPGAVYEARFLPDGKRLAVGGSGGRIDLFDVDDWSLLDTLEIGDDDRTIVALAAAPDGSRIVTSATPVDGLEPTGPARLYVLDLEDGAQLTEPAETGEAFIDALAIDAERDLVFAAGEEVQPYALDTLEPEGEAFGDGGPLGFLSVDVGAGGVIAAASGIDLQLFAPAADGWAAVDVDAAAVAVAFVDDGRVMVTVDFEGSLWTWIPGWIDELGEPLRPEGPGHVTASPDGSAVAVWGSRRGVLLFGTAEADHRATLPLDDVRLHGVDIDPEGRRVATLSCPVGEYGPDDPCPAELTVWDADAAEPVAGPVDAGEVWAWMTLGAAFTGDGGEIVTAGYTGDIRRWDATTLERVADPLLLGDAAELAAGQARVVDANLVDGRSLVVAKGQQFDAVVWDISDGDAALVGTFGGNLSDVGFVGEQLAAAQGSGTFQLYDALTLEPLGEPFVTDVPTFWFSASDTGTLASSGGIEGSQLWDIESRQLLSGRLASTSAVLTADGSRLYLGGQSRPGEVAGDVVRVLSLEPEYLLAEACRRAGRNLTAAEWERYLPPGEAYRPTCEGWPGSGDGL